MNRHHVDRRPKKTGGFAWGRFASARGMEYRLFRRDMNGALHYEARIIDPCAPLEWAAFQLRIARRQLRDRVDGIDLARMGMIE